MIPVQRANTLPKTDPVIGSRLLSPGQQSVEPLLLKKSLSVSSLLKLTPEKETLQEGRIQRGFSPQRILIPSGLAASTLQRGDDFWDALCTHYNYLMDEGLIATCREANNELSNKVEGDCDWSFTEFIQKFNELHDALHTLLSEVACITHAKEDLATAGVLDKLQAVVFGCKQFKEQSQQLGQRYPDMKDEINRRVNLLNNKWETLEQAVHPHKPQPTQEALFNEVSHEMRCLRRWLRDVEDRLLPTTDGFYGWTLEHLQNKHQGQQVLQKEIESRGQLVSSLLHLCDRLQQESSAESQSGDLAPPSLGSFPWDAERVCRVAANLEKRWHALWLRSLEEQCRVEELIRKCKAGLLPSDPSLEASFGEEPPHKHPRLTGGDVHFWSPRKNMSERAQSPEDVEESVDQPGQLLRQNDKAVMVGSTGIAQLKAEYGTSPFGRFEIIQDVGYSSESSTHLSGEDNHEFIQVYSYSPATRGRTIVTEYKVCRDDKEKEIPQLDTSMDWQLTSEEDDDFFLDNLPPTLSSSPKRESPEESDAHLDLSSTTTLVNRSLIEELGGFSVQELVSQAETMVREDSRKRSLIQGSQVVSNSLALGKGKFRSERVQEWLQECGGSKAPLTATASRDEVPQLHIATLGSQPQEKDVARAVESSCDASGEYTTNESSENSGSESGAEGIHKRHGRCLSHSGTGSLETVVPLMNPVSGNGTTAESHDDGTLPHPPSSGSRVVLRSKKRNKRDRPWSVTELYQASNQLNYSPFSTSEGALNMVGKSRIVPGSAPLSVHQSPSEDQIVPQQNSPLRRHHRRHRSRVSLPVQCQSGVPQTEGHSSSSDGRSSCTDRRGCSEGSAQPVRSSYCSSDSAQCSSQCSCPSRHGSSSNSQIKRHGKNKKRKPTSSDDLSKARERLLSKNPPETTSSTGAENLSVQLEDQSSVSDQAWDSYEDPPYLSEPYSEQTPDAEQIKRLIDFGDDYRAFISSDASSSVSGRTANRTAIRGRSLTNNTQGSMGGESDTDSEVEELQCLLQDSSSALLFARNTLRAQRKSECGTLVSTDSVELLATCQTHLKCLQVISQHLDPSYHLLSTNLHENLLQELLAGWEMLQGEVLSCQENGQQFQEVKQELEALKEKMAVLAKVLEQSGSTYASMDEILQRIAALQNSLSLLHETKTWLLSVNLKVHRFLTESGLTYSSMKDNVTQLYATWDDVYEQSGSQLTELQEAHNIWQQFIQNRQKLEAILAQEELDQGSLSSVDYWQAAERSQTMTQAEGMLLSLHQDAQALKPFLQEQSEAWTALKAHLQALTDKLHTIKLEHPQRVQELLRPSLEVKEALPVRKSKVSIPKVVKESKAESGSSEERRRRRSRFWRALRAALPLQVAMVLLYCLAWLMEPQCCDFLNSMHFTLSPTLRYLKGPPPT